MSDEKIQLPDFLIAELYKGSLVDIDTINLKTFHAESEEVPVLPLASTVTAKKIKFLGENEKRVTIVVNKTETAFLTEDELIFLTNILKACHLNLADIAIVNVAAQHVSYAEIKEELTPLTILLFDVEPSYIQLPFLIPAFQLQQFDGCTIMVAPALPIINQPTQEGKLLKTKLWMSLRQVFNIV